MKMVQVFVGNYEDNACEVNARLLKIKYTNAVLEIMTSEVDSKSTFTHIFPLWNVSMVRIWND